MGADYGRHRGERDVGQAATTEFDLLDVVEHVDTGPHLRQRFGNGERDGRRRTPTSHIDREACTHELLGGGSQRLSLICGCLRAHAWCIAVAGKGEYANHWKARILGSGSYSNDLVG